MRTIEYCFCFSVRVDAVVSVGAFDLGAEGQLPRNDDDRRWTHDVCRAERQNIAFFGAVDNHLEVAVHFFKKSAVDKPRHTVGRRISFFELLWQLTVDTYHVGTSSEIGVQRDGRNIRTCNGFTPGRVGLRRGARLVYQLRTKGKIVSAPLPNGGIRIRITF